MTLGGWLSVAAICTLGAMSPGPSLAVVLRHALHSRAQGIACALAHAAGVGAYALAAATGLAAVLAAHPLLQQAVTLAGAAYLLWLGLASWRAGGSGADDDRIAAPAARRPAARDGLTIALLNPKIAVFFLALFSQFVDAEAGPREVALLVATAAVIDGAWYTLVASVLSASALAGRLRRGRRGLLRATGVLLVAVAAWTLLHALRAI